mmetsp:Transcript_46780/g.77151  ORF Transcript_46780/g.77151 Transcript_46780/m.77151 type:complete len:107 (+) Transcript_46780:101-421(+)
MIYQSRNCLIGWNVFIVLSLLILAQTLFLLLQHQISAALLQSNLWTTSILIWMKVYTLLLVRLFLTGLPNKLFQYANAQMDQKLCTSCISFLVVDASEIVIIGSTT